MRCERENWKSGHSPPLGASVLEPRLHLGIGHLQSAGQCRSLRGRQILLLVEALLQLGHLDAREGCAWLFPLRRRAILVGMSDPSGDRKGSCNERDVKYLITLAQILYILSTYTCSHIIN